MSTAGLRAPQVRRTRLDHPSTTTLAIEVAQTSRSRDLGLKAALSAAASVPEYWVVDLARNLLVVHRDPAGEAFRTIANQD